MALLKMWHEIFVAVCLVMVIEGILPFISPRLWRQAVMQAAQMDERSIRLVGLCSMIAGTLLLYWIN